MFALYSLNIENPAVTGGKTSNKRVVWCIGACKPIRRNPARMPFLLAESDVKIWESRLSQGPSRLELSPRQPEGSCLPGQRSPSQPVLLLFLASQSTYEAQILEEALARYQAAGQEGGSVTACSVCDSVLADGEGSAAPAQSNQTGSNVN